MLETRMRVLGWTLFGGVVLGGWTSAQDDSPRDAFKELDTPRKEFHNLNIETVRGMVWSPDRSRIYAINTHGSRLVRHDDPDGVIDRNWTTVHNPVAVALWERSPVDYDLLVLGGTSHTLALHDPFTGAIKELLILPSEPGDLVVSPDGRAFVSCMGPNVVVEIDLATFQIRREYSIPSQRPRFLFLMNDGQVPLGFRVFVAPFLSGNNTRRNAFTAPPTVVALPPDIPGTPTLEGLPDEDLFELVPPTTGSGPGTVNPVVKGIGHLMLEHAMVPGGLYWALSIVPQNADPARQTEPALNGDFATNAVTLFTLPAQGATPIVAPAPIDLDDFVVGNGQKDYATGESCSFPFAVAVDPVTRWALIAGSTSDRLILLDANGNRVGWKRDLPVGSIPRDILIDRVNDTVTIYLWGTNKLLVLAISDLNGPGLVLDLGLDPTPASVAHGRELWYDGDNSKDGRFTCNTCHPGGASDFLGWPLSADPEDRKDVMVTQSLLSIEDTFPYHWRGERELRDFNRLAFPGLLGGQSLLGQDFEDFKEFVFSLQAPRNPIEAWSREVVGGAVQGQKDFREVDALGAFTCLECHSQPEGSNGSVSADNASGFPSAAQLDVAHLRQLYNKENPMVKVVVGTNVLELPRLGWGISHDGDNFDVFDFLRNPFPFTITDQQRSDITEFVQQFDQGIAPAAQLGWLLDNAHQGTATDIQTFLLNQAAKGWLDVIAFGTIKDANSNVVFARWSYDPGSGTFQANDPALQLVGRPAGTALFTDFTSQAAGNSGSNTFLGMPLGNGRRFALDPDNDQLLDGVELARVPPLDPEDRDTDGDGDPDGHEETNGGDADDPAVVSNDTTLPGLVTGFPAFVDAGAKTAEYELRFTEPVTYTITYSRPGGPVLSRTRFHPVVEDTITLQEMQPSSKVVVDSSGTVLVPGTPSTYTLQLTMRDQRVGTPNSVVAAVAHQPTTDDQLEPFFEPNQSGAIPGGLPLALVLDSLSMTTSSSGNTLTGTVTANVAAMHEGLNGGGYPGFLPQQNQIVLAQVLVDSGTGWNVVPAGQISPAGTAVSSYLLDDGLGNTLPGPLNDVVVMPATGATGGPGSTGVVFSISNLSSGDKVRFNIVGIYQSAGPPVGGSPVFVLTSTFAWQLPSTQDDPGGNPALSLRGAEVTF